MDQTLYQQIISEYRKTGSVDLTARACGTYPIKVRKVLITEGLWHSKKSDAVNALRQRGYAVSEIAEELGMDEKNVQFYLPYTDGALSGKETGGGKRIRSFRERSKNAADGSMSRKQEMNSEGDGREKPQSPEKPASPVDKTNTRASVAPGTGKAMNHPRTAQTYRDVWHGYLLHAELVLPRHGSDEDCEDIFSLEKSPEVLRTLLKTKNGITRDLIVPGTMSLHQLSYALQKAFGFQNCHLHHFSFPKNLLRQMTDNRIGHWKELCGVYLHAPVFEDFEDLYWDDDYREGKSPNNWMKSKYTGDGVDYAVGETFIDSLRLMKEEREWVEKQMREEKDPELRQFRNYEDLPLDVCAREYSPEENLNRVLERLKVQEIFDLEPLPASETESWRRDLKENNQISSAYLDACRQMLSFRSLEDAMDTLRLMRTDRHQLDQGIWLNRKELKEELGRDPEGLLDVVNREILELEHHLGEAMHAFDPPAEPVTDTLYYNYDYGDGWLLRVTCREIFTRQGVIWETGKSSEDLFAEAGKQQNRRDPGLEKKLKEHVLQRDFSDEYEYENTKGEWVNDDLRSALIRAELQKEPVCVGAEGLPLMEDVGGVYGFFDFLRTVHGEDADEATRMRVWARSLGWKEVRPKPESLL